METIKYTINIVAWYDSGCQPIRKPMIASSPASYELNKAYAQSYNDEWPYDPRILLDSNRERRGIPRTEWQWIEVFWDERSIIKEIYRNKITSLHDEVISIQKHIRQAKKIITEWNSRWALEVIVDNCDEEIKKIEQRIRHYEFIIKFMAKPAQKQNTLDVDRAKSVPLEQLFEGQLFTRSGKLTGRCPFHEERTPSFVIYQDNHYHCFGCNETGDSINYVRKTKNLGFREAVNYLMNV